MKQAATRIEDTEYEQFQKNSLEYQYNYFQRSANVHSFIHSTIIMVSHFWCKSRRMQYAAFETEEATRFATKLSMENVK